MVRTQGSQSLALGLILIAAPQLEVNKIANSDYSAVREGRAGLIDLSPRGRILVSGSEAVMFLNGLITNDIKTLAANSWMRAAFPNVQGRLLAVVRILNRADGFLIDTEATTHDKVVHLLERFTLAGDFRVTDLTDRTACYSVQGSQSAAILRDVFGETSAADPRRVITANLKDAEVTIIRDTHTAEDGFDLFVERNDADHLRSTLASAGAEPVSDATAEVLRVEAGIARYDIDMDETTIVTETNLDDVVSFTKGCYLGQEIIVRIKHRGHVAKKITGLTFPDRIEIENGAKILSVDDKEIGRVTSSTFSPTLNQTIALGYVKYDYREAGTGVQVLNVKGVVAELPFVRGSWVNQPG
jgi:folate-binding protein YgfZ